MRWIVEFGHIDIATEVHCHHNTQHYQLKATWMILNISRLIMVYTTIHVFAWIQPIQTLTMTSSQLWIGKNYMTNGNIKEPIPPNATKPMGKPVDVCMFVDSNHAWDKQTRCFHCSFLTNFNAALIDWHLKHQATIETEVFGTELVAMKVGVDMLRGLTYKLRMMGVLP